MKYKKWKGVLLLTLLGVLMTGCQKETAQQTQSEEIIDETVVAPPATESDALFDITERTLTIPGLSGEYSFLYLTDTHIISLDGTESEQITENALPRAGVFVDATGTSSAERFPAWMDYANDNAVDMLLLGGDIIDFPSPENLSLLDENIQTLKMPYIYTLGNHDWTYPWEYMTENSRQIYRPLFDKYTNHTPAATCTEYEELVLLSVDNSSNQLDPEALATVDYALSLGKPVIVMMHVPLSTDTLLSKASALWSSPVSIAVPGKEGIYPDEATYAFEQKILAPESPVVCILAGHAHVYDEAALTDTIVQIVGGPGYAGEGFLLHIKGDS